MPTRLQREISLNELNRESPTMHSRLAYKPIHWPDLFTWTTHSREHTTLLEATTLQEAQLCTTLELDVQHCNRFLLVHIYIE